MRIRTMTLLVSCAALMVLAGCGQKASEDKPIAEVKADAEKMSVADLQKMVEDYTAAIKAKTDELAKVKEKLKPEELLTNEQVKKLTASIANLNTRMQVYADELTKKKALK